MLIIRFPLYTCNAKTEDQQIQGVPGSIICLFWFLGMWICWQNTATLAGKSNTQLSALHCSIPKGVTLQSGEVFLYIFHIFNLHIIWLGPERHNSIANALSYVFLALTGWETKIFWHLPELGILLYSLYKIPLAQACFPLARLNFIRIRERASACFPAWLTHEYIRCWQRRWYEQSQSRTGREWGIPHTVHTPLCIRTTKSEGPVLLKIKTLHHQFCLSKMNFLLIQSK